MILNDYVILYTINSLVKKYFTGSTKINREDVKNCLLSNRADFDKNTLNIIVVLILNRWISIVVGDQIKPCKICSLDIATFKIIDFKEKDGFLMHMNYYFIWLYGVL